MNHNFKNRPVKSTPQEYEKWIKGLEKELSERLTKLKETLDYKRTDFDVSRYLFIQELLGA